MSQVLGAFGLLDFTMLQPVVAWRAFWNLRTICLILGFLFWASVNRGYLKPWIVNQWIWSTHVYFILTTLAVKCFLYFFSVNLKFFVVYVLL
jgi:hypothetical protein